MPKKIAHKSTWKNKQAKKQMQKKTRLGILVLLLIIILIIIGQMVNFGRTLFKPWNLKRDDPYITSMNGNFRWDERFNINLVIKAKTIAVLSLNPTEGEVTIINFPDNTLMDVSGGFGKWQIRSVYDLGLSEGMSGRQLLEKTASSFLGVPIDGFLEFKDEFAEKSPNDLVQEFHESILSGISKINSLQTNLTPVELIRLKFYLTQIRFDKLKKVDLEKVDILEKSKLNDGTIVYVADPVKIDSILTLFIDPVIRKEHMTIAVLNATDYPQLAQKAARIITNLGGNVIIVKNAEKSYVRTQVTGEKSATLTRLTQIFGLGCNNNPKCDKIDPDVEIGRAQINIVLGEDFYKDR